MPYKSREAVTNLSNGYSSIKSEEKYETISGKKIPGISVLVARGKVSDKSNLKILNPKEMLQRFLIAFVQVKTGKRSKELLNEIRKIIYDLYWEKEITKKVNNNIVNSIKF